MQSPWFPPFPAPLACPTLSPCQPAWDGTCPVLPLPTPSGLQHRRHRCSGAESLASVCLGSGLGLKTPTSSEMALRAGGRAGLGRRACVWLLTTELPGLSHEP